MVGLMDLNWAEKWGREKVGLKVSSSVAMLDETTVVLMESKLAGCLVSWSVGRLERLTAEWLEKNSVEKKVEQMVDDLVD